MIYLIRHGQTVFNAERRFQGHCDSPLTALGEAQARSVGRTLRRLTEGDDGWTIVASPLGRARQTAQIIHTEMAHPREIEFDDRLREISMGEWDGRTLAELEAMGVPVGGLPAHWRFNAPGGESLDAFYGRLSDWLADAQARFEKLIALTHGGSGRMIRGAYLGLTQEQMFNFEFPQDAIFHLANGTIDRIDCEVTEKA